MKCTYDPRTLAGQPIGQFHCPECGVMQIAGLPHIDDDNDDLEVIDAAPAHDSRLLPCPFCSGQPVAWSIPFHGWCVECRRCGIVLSKYQETEVETSRDDAVAYWNRRLGLARTA